MEITPSIRENLARRSIVILRIQLVFFESFAGVGIFILAIPNKLISKSSPKATVSSAKQSNIWKQVNLSPMATKPEPMDMGIYLSISPSFLVISSLSSENLLSVGSTAWATRGKSSNLSMEGTFR